jgi:hypothetical protein
MYWIYLSLFVLIVIIPKVVSGDRLFLLEDDQESILIFFVGAIGLLIYLWKENQLRFQLREKVKIQKEASRVSRDLADSYSYIAEINRKMEIVKNIALGLPETSSVTPERLTELYESILEALSLLGKTDTFFLCVVDVRSGNVAKKFDVRGKRCPVLKYSELAKRNETVLREGEYVIIRSSKRMKGCLAFIVLRKKNGVIEDPEIFKALAAQALFLYSIEQEHVEAKKKEEKKGE